MLRHEPTEWNEFDFFSYLRLYEIAYTPLKRVEMLQQQPQLKGGNVAKRAFNEMEGQDFQKARGESLW